MKRRFNRKQRAALFAAADGRCESCGCELPPGWHADHIVPYSKGGPTDVLNGAALCPTCNLQKGNKLSPNSSAPLRTWQINFLDQFRSTSGVEDDFLLWACPAAGKTRASIEAASDYDQVVVVAPGTDVKRRWLDDFAEARSADAIYDTAITLDTRIPKRVEVLGVTFHGLIGTGIWAEIIRTWSSKRSTLLIVDEVHHTSDAKASQSQWAKGVLRVRDACDRSLLLTGTPVRTDQTPLALVKYKDGKFKAHFSYTLTDGWNDGIIREPHFRVEGGEVTWEYAGEAKRSAVLENLEFGSYDVPAAHNAAIDANGVLVGKMLRDAEDDICRRRYQRPDAAVLHVCKDIDHAEAIARRLKSLTGQEAAIVTSDTDDSHKTLARLRTSSEAHIIAVNMISEGVDIPRIEVINYLTNVRTPLRFHQIIGRAMRRKGDDDHAKATIFLPSIPDLVELAKAIEDEWIAFVKERESVEPRDALEGTQPTRELLESTSIAAHGATIYEPGWLPVVDSDPALAMVEKFMPWLPSDEQVTVARLIRKGIPAGSVSMERRPVAQEGNRDRLSRKRNECDQLAKQLAHRKIRAGEVESFNEAMPIINGELKSKYGPRDDWTEDQYDRAIAFLKSQLRMMAA